MLIPLSPSILARVLVGLTTTLPSIPTLGFSTTLTGEPEEDDEEEPTLEQSLDAGLKLTRQIVPVRFVPYSCLASFNISSDATLGIRITPTVFGRPRPLPTARHRPG